ncbi:MAG: resolvase, partial [Firmicutes bacterium]|nr:resolvase [Bacillota bacterium]
MKTKIASDKVAIYIRWSTEDQGQGHTLEIQRESCRYYCMSQGWVARDELTFIDDGWSGSNLERPALARLRDSVRAGQVECAVVYKLDRLSRNIKDIINLVLDEWEEACCVRSTQEPVDTTSDAGKMFFTMLGSFADFERSSIKSRTWSGKVKNAEKGRNPGMVYPFGLQKAEAGGWEIREDEAAVVRRIFAEYLRGRSCRLIAFGLNDQGTPTRSGRMWQNADISRLLRNPLYAGRLVFNRRAFAQKKKLGRVVEKDAAEVISCDGAAPAIVDQESWDQAARIRAGRPRVNRGASARTQSSPYLLSGLLKCPCGHAWVGIQGGKQNQRFYACAGARSAGAAKCASRSITAATLDGFVVARVRETWPLKGGFRADMLEGLADRLREHEVRVKALKGRFSAVEALLERFKGDYKAGKLAAEVYMELTRESRAEREQISGQLAAADAERREIAGSQVDLEQAGAWYARLDEWDALALTEQQQILRMLIARVVVSRPKGAQDVSIHVDWRL